VIKKHFFEHLAQTTNKIKVAKNGNKTMFMHTWGFRFLDIINYLGPGTSYEKWVKATNVSQRNLGYHTNGLTPPKSLIFQGFQTIQNGIRSKREDIFSLWMSMQGARDFSKKRGCAPSKTGCVSTIISMWLPVLRLWKR